MLGGVGVNRKWSGISLRGHVGVWVSNRKWSEISLGVMVGGWGSTGSGLGLVWGSCGWCGGKPEVV